MCILKPSLVGGLTLLVAVIASGCSSPDQTFFIYRLPFQDETEILVWQDHLTHPGGNQLDLRGAFADPPYSVVAARPGTVRFIADTFTVNCSSAEGCFNNYVWIEHTPGDEWAKYVHLATGTITGPPPDGASLSVGDQVVAGQYLGQESNIGMAVGTDMGRHLHFEVAVPDDPATATPMDFAGDFPYELKVPRFCGVPGQVVVKDSVYVASPCPSD